MRTPLWGQKLCWSTPDQNPGSTPGHTKDSVMLSNVLFVFTIRKWWLPSCMDAREQWVLNVWTLIRWDHTVDAMVMARFSKLPSSTSYNVENWVFDDFNLSKESTFFLIAEQVKSTKRSVTSGSCTPGSSQPDLLCKHHALSQQESAGEVQDLQSASNRSHRISRKHRKLGGSEQMGTAPVGQKSSAIPTSQIFAYNPICCYLPRCN